MSACSLCASTDDVATFDVPTRGTPADLCSVCLPQVQGAELDPNHWYCLQGSAWSDDPAIQVLAWRLLTRLDEGWAKDLLGQLYLPDDVLEWASEGVKEAGPPVLDANGTELHEGDAVTLIKDLNVKGAGFTAKRGTLVKNIRLGDDPGLIEGRVNGVVIYLKTEFLKRAN
jgi:protein PhnA